MSQSSDNQELNRILSKGFAGSSQKNVRMPAEAMSVVEVNLGSMVQWTTCDKKRFVPASNTESRLTPGVYEIQQSPTVGIYFEKIPVKTEGLLRFPQTADRVLSEIENFWGKEDIFREYKLTHKRGIILWGCPGGGKSSLIQLIMKDVIERDGIVIKFGYPKLFLEGMRIFREIEPITPVVVLMEDIDSILEVYNESEVLNVLDGVDLIQRLIFLATTNYPERLGARILNRPSRFDKRFKIDHLSAENRMLYLRHIIGDKKLSELKIDLRKWVKDTDKFSVAHLKELFVAVVILGDDYNEAIETLRSMKEGISSEDDSDKIMGFGRSSAVA